MNIEEEEIFNFIYNPELLDKDKRLYIANNAEKFENELNFYTLLKEQQKKPVPKEIEDSIIEKIISYQHPKLKFLISESLDEDNNEDNIHSEEIVAAPERKDSNGVFIDENSDFIVKIVHLDNFSHIYLSNKNNAPIKNYSITINSTKEVFFSEDNSSPIIVSGKIDVTDVRLSFK